MERFFGFLKSVHYRFRENGFVNKTMPFYETLKKNEEIVSIIPAITKTIGYVSNTIRFISRGVRYA